METRNSCTCPGGPTESMSIFIFRLNLSRKIPLIFCFKITTNRFPVQMNLQVTKIYMLGGNHLVSACKEILTEEPENEQYFCYRYEHFYMEYALKLNKTIFCYLQKCQSRCFCGSFSRRRKNGWKPP